MTSTKGELRKITVADGSVTTMFTEQAQFSEPTWLTDDQMLVMRSTITGSPMLAGGDDLYLVDLEAGESLNLINWLSAPTVTSVAPGGVWWAVTVGSNGSSDVLLRSLSQGRTLTSDGTSMGAKWQPRPAAAQTSPSPTAPDPFSSLAFQSIHVGSGDVAWASTDTRLYRTSDSGATWTEVQPPVPNASVSVAPDANTAFLVKSNPGAMVWVTRDAGHSWTEVPFPREDGATLPRLTFATPSHGFARFQEDRSALRSYETTDGGRTWTGPVVTSLPQGMLTKVQGSDHGVLWLSNGKADNEPFDNRLLISIDGGASWQEGRFPTGPQAPKNDLKWVEALWADGTGRVVLAMSTGDGPQLHVSDDGAQSWRFVRSWPSFVSGNTTVGYHVALLSGDEWILVAEDGSGSWSTLDGGASWQRVTSSPTARFDEVSVMSANRFLAVLRCDPSNPVKDEVNPACGDGTDTILLVTSDGGRTWTQVTN